MKAYLISYEDIEVIVSTPLRHDDLGSTRLRIDHHHLESLNFIQSTPYQTLTKLSFKTKKPLILGRSYEVIIESFGASPIDVSQAIYFPNFDETYTYHGDDLGFTYTPSKTTFKLWAPLASHVNLTLYDQRGERLYYEMKRQAFGVYEVSINGNYDGVFYRYEVTNNGVTVQTIDPYGKGSSRNSEYSVVINFDALKRPMYDEALPPMAHSSEAIIYETHVRDLTSDLGTNVVHKGRFLGMVEQGKTYHGTIPVGFDYIKALGITHLQLLPVQDYKSVDEFNVAYSYNWGYDPYQYFSLEGSFASDLDDPYSRIRDFLTLVATYHQIGIRINIDVVYNHVYEFQYSVFEKVVPGYYFRKQTDGTMSNGSFCGNDLSTTRPMVRKLIVDSCRFLVSTYHLDGFRFDLMGIIDMETMHQIKDAVMEINPSFMFYGEGWDMPTALDPSHKSRTENSEHLPYVSFFNDLFRNLIKGGNFEGDILDKGFVFGHHLDDRMLAFLFSGSANGQFHVPKVKHPYQSINYVECHDNGTFYDKLIRIFPHIATATVSRYVRLINAMVMFAQGIPFFHMGQEVAGTKQGHHNSYNAGDAYNQMQYAWVEQYPELITSFAALTTIRKTFTILQSPYHQPAFSYHRHQPYLFEIRYAGDPSLHIYFNTASFPIHLPLESPSTLIYDGVQLINSFNTLTMIEPLSCIVLTQKQT
jgi:pullulanase